MQVTGQSEVTGSPSRRQFMQKTLAAGVATSAGALAGPLLTPKFAHATFADGSDAMRIGVIGCGGRGTGAAINAIHTDTGVRVVAMADMFEHRPAQGMETITEWLEKHERTEGLAVAPEHQFLGFDGFKQLLALDEVDYVILATPCAFRPDHVEAAIAAGKHIFMEKPAGVDPAGVRRILASTEEARRKNLALVGGTQARFSEVYRILIDKARSGEFGELYHGIANWNSGGIWKRETEPHWDETQKQVHNWLNYIWLGGDIILDYTVHNIDAVCWMFDDYPVEAYGTGGRAALDAEGRGGIYDHFNIDYRFRDGRTMAVNARMIPNALPRVGEQYIFGNGVGNSQRWTSTFRTYDGNYTLRENNDTLKAANPLVQEHKELIDSIRAGKPLITADATAKSTLAAIMGRMAAYTGQVVTWDFVMNESTLDYSQAHPHRPGPQPAEPVPVPGQEALV